MIVMRFTRRHGMYGTNDRAAFPLDAARQLHAMRVAVGEYALVPPSPQAGEAPTPQRQPGSMVKK
jgi:hypothetical protein